MSDLESAASRAPIITSAAGKLQSLSGSKNQFGETDEIVDAFADVFAQMAISTPPPIQSVEPATETVDEESGEVQKTADSDDREHSSDSESRQAGQASAAINHQPLVAERQENQTVDVDVNTREQVAAEDVKVDNSGRSDDQPDVQDAVIAEVETTSEENAATTAKTEQTVESIVVAAVETGNDRKNRRETKASPDEGPVKAPTENEAPTEKPHSESAVKTRDVPTDHQHHSDDHQPGERQTEQNTGPPERTTRQKFLAAKRSDRGGNQSTPNQAPETNTARPTDVTTDSSTLSEPVPGNAPPKTLSAVRASIAAQSVIDPAAANAKSTAAKIPASNAGNRGDARTTTQPVQNESGSRVDRPAGRQTRPSKSDAANTTARAKLVQRVSRAFQHLGPEGGVVRLRLAPAELGSVRVEMQIRQRKVQARVVAETEAASNALREHLPDLRSRLESYGMQVERLEIETDSGDQQSGLPFDREPEQRQPQQRRPRRESLADQPSTTADRSDQDRPETTAAGHPSLATQGVDMRL